MLIKLQRKFSWLGLIFIFLYAVYVGGYSNAVIFKYSLVIGVVFLTLDLILYIVNLIRSRD